MNELWTSIYTLMTGERVLSLVRAVAIGSIGIPVARWSSRALVKLWRKRVTAQSAMLIQRLSYYAMIVSIVVMVLDQLGFELSVVLGAAGILTVAVGFASQTSASNIISGLFLIGERPFVVGDFVKIRDTTGEVLSIDLLSVRLRTYDNLLVRVPNETLIKSEITNLSHFPIRRADLQISVAYKENLAEVRKVLEEVANRNPMCLEEPAPMWIFKGFGASGLEIQFSVWAARLNFLDLKNELTEEVKIAFDAHGIEIPFPHVSVYAGSATTPLPIRLVPAPPAEPVVARPAE